MKKTAILTLIVLLSFNTLKAQYQISYHYNVGNPGGINQLDDNSDSWSNLLPWLSNFGWANNSYQLNFPFYFNGKLVNKLYVSNNGILVFDTLTTVKPPNHNLIIPNDSLPPNSIACFWDQFTVIPNTSSNPKIKYCWINRLNDNDQIWIKWHSFPLGNYSSFNYFACVLEENTNNIYIVDYRYSNSGNLLTTTVGIQFDTLHGQQVAQSPNIPIDSTGSYIFSDNSYYKFEFLGLISENPTDTATCLNGNAKFITRSFYNTSSLQWQHKDNTGNWLNLSNSSVYSGVTSDTLKVLVNVLSLNNSQYRCIVTSQTLADTSSVAILTTGYQPTIDLGNDTTLCAYENITLSAGNWNQYLWSSGDTMSNLYVDSLSGTYSVTITDNIGCTSSDSIQINFEPKIQTSNIIGPNYGVAHDTINLEVVNTPGSIYNWGALFNGLIIGGNSTNKIDAVLGSLGYGPASYIVVETAQNGCLGDTILKQIGIGNIGLSNKAENDLFEIYPNPADDKVFVKILTNTNSTIVLELLDISGKIIYKNNYFNKEIIEIDVSELKAASYIINVYQDKKSSKQKILIK